MWNRKDLKKNARKSMRLNYWNSVIVCFILFIFAGIYISSSTATQVVKEITPNFKVSSNAEIVNTMLGLGREDIREPVHYSLKDNGILAGTFNNITKSGSFFFGILNACNQFIFKDRIAAGSIILIGSALVFLYWIFVKSILVVGACRFFLENRYNQKTEVNRILYIHKTRKTGNIAKIMLIRGLYIILWFLTIIGGIIKSYSYCMVPYIVAENPDISAKEALILSEQMMKGNKWGTFKLDISFLLWHLLSVVTLGLVGFLFLNPYMTATGAELYVTLREQTLDGKINLYKVKEYEGKHWLAGDHHRNYKVSSLVLLFFSFSFIGWIWEVGFTAFTQGVIVNRGVLLGLWLPIYGSGGVLLLLILKRWRDRPVVTFFGAVFICAVIEYGTGWFLESFYKTKWWDYSGYLLNLNGRICFEGLLVFGLGGCVIIYFLAPILDRMILKLSMKVTILICIVLCIIFVTDFIVSIGSPNMGKGITITMNIVNL